MKFNHNFYKYQKDILKIFEEQKKIGDKKIHIVAPPGSGKTIIGLEIINRIGGNTLILVPNTVLQKQWKNKLEKFFLEKNENINSIVSTSTSKIKKINIITYQALTQITKNNDNFLDEIYKIWFKDFSIDFKNYELFLNFIEELKETDNKKYQKYILKYKKKLKKNGKAKEFLSEKVLNYFENLKKAKINSIVLDESHHLTNWWSKSIYFLWEYLSEINNIPYIIGLTATPPYLNADFFILDEDYTKLLGEVDYYVPSPSVIKSGKLAPYNDFVYFVEAPGNLKENLKKYDETLDNFLLKNKDFIVEKIIKIIEKDFEKLLNKSFNNTISYIKFLRVFSNYDISNYYFSEKIGEELNLEDIAKTVGRFLANYRIKGKTENIEKVKKIFYDLGYIWRGSNFFKFRTPIENMLIYSESKIIGVKKILDLEYKNLGKNLKCAIITDFLNEKNGIINCKFILKNLKQYYFLNPILVSGEAIWKYNEKQEIIKIDSNILEITKLLESGETKLLIGTRGILGEGWDSIGLNTLIDLTGIIAYMSINQVRGRPIRINPKNKKKFANIYDIVCIFEGYNKKVDFNRLKRKHQNTYGIDDNGYIIKGLDHILTNLENRIDNYKELNKITLERALNRDYYYKLWKIGDNYKNKEIYALNIFINKKNIFLPFIEYNFKDISKLKNLLENKEKNFFYINFLNYRFLKIFIEKIVNSMKISQFLPNDFEYKIDFSKNGEIKILSYYRNDLVIKKFILELKEIFSTCIKQKYILKYNFGKLEKNKIIEEKIFFPLGDSLAKNIKLRKIFIKQLENKKFYFFTSFLYIKFLSLFNKNYKEINNFFNLIKNFNNKKKKFELIYINSKNTQKKDFIGKKPFIEANIEKIWI